MTKTFLTVNIGDLDSPDGNAFAILGHCSQMLKAAGVHDAVYPLYAKEAMNGDYRHLLATTCEWFITLIEQDGHRGRLISAPCPICKEDRFYAYSVTTTDYEQYDVSNRRCHCILTEHEERALINQATT